MEGLTIIEQLSQLRITASSQIPPHEFLYIWNGTPCFAKGELVAVTGKAKSGKTYLNSLLMAAASGQTFIGLKSLSDKPLRVLWIDTEQSPDSTCEILRDRIGAMIGEKPSEEQYHVFNLRSVNWQDRMLHVVTAISICRPDLVIFDGIRDVVGEINNYEEAHNDDFRAQENEEQLLVVYFDIPRDGEGQFMTTAEISDKLVSWGSIKKPMPLNRLGMLLKKAGYRDVRRGEQRTRGWIVYERTLDEVNANRNKKE